MLRGEGRAFSAGGDLKRALTLHTDLEWMAAMGASLRRLLERFEQNGPARDRGRRRAVRGGRDRVDTACDFVIASDRARFSDGQSEFQPRCREPVEHSGMPRAIGVLQCEVDVLLTARLFDGQEAAAMQLVTRCVPSGDLGAGMSRN